MIDNYGNYFCQRLLSTCSPSQRISILNHLQISGKFVEICKDKKGTHTVQSFLDVMTMEEEEKLFAANIKGFVYELSMDPQATHVVQKAMLSFSEPNKEFIIEEALSKFVELCDNANGLSLIKKLIPECCKNLEKIKRIITIMSNNSMELVQNPYGNYAIQSALEALDIEQFAPILDSLKGKYTQLSLLKFSSNVVERCLEKADISRRDSILKEFTNGEKLLGKKYFCKVF